MPTSPQKFLFAILLLVVAAAPAQASLTPDQIALVVNADVPDSLKLAQLYAQKRGIPDGRIISVKVTSTEEIQFDSYEKDVVPVVRQFLRANGLDKKVICLVTFYGLPLRIHARSNNDADKAELADVQKEFSAVMANIKSTTHAMEKLCTDTDKSFKPPTNKEELEALAARSQTALNFMRQQIQSLNGQSPERAQQLTEQIDQIVSPIAGTVQPSLRQLQALSVLQNKTPEQSQQEAQLKFELDKLDAQFSDLQDKRYDSVARGELRKLAKPTVGDFEYARLLEAQIQYFDPSDAESAFDNELALVWWNGYSRKGWQPNPLNYVFSVKMNMPTMMVCRLDAPQPSLVNDMILTSIQVEHDGLKGGVVLDSRGIAEKKSDGKVDPYGEYDQTIRNLALLITDKTKLTLLHDDKPEVLPANSAKDVAIYCGWYSLGHYVRCCTFNPGAVGFHIASSEMVSLHTDNGQWARHLLIDGVVSTLGPVSEPYLSSFPRADDFFPLLFTGKLTLAEVYWKTNPMTSWRETFIGDPLYTPYKVNPPLKVEDLPDRLRPIFNTDAPVADMPERAAPQ